MFICLADMGILLLLVLCGSAESIAGRIQAQDIFDDKQNGDTVFKGLKYRFPMAIETIHRAKHADNHTDQNNQHQRLIYLASKGR